MGSELFNRLTPYLPLYRNSILCIHIFIPRNHVFSTILDFWIYNKVPNHNNETNKIIFECLLLGHSSEKERRIIGKNSASAANSQVDSILKNIQNCCLYGVLHFFCGAFVGKNFYSHFCLFFTQKVEFVKKKIPNNIFSM